LKDVISLTRIRHQVYTLTYLHWSPLETTFFIVRIL
jgi:hypothetical protein